MSSTSSRLNYHFSAVGVQQIVGLKDSGEVVILKEGHVKVTNLRVMIGIRTYLISKIHSARVHVYESKLFLPVFFMLVASVCLALVALSDMDAYSQFLSIGLVIGIAGFLFLLLSTKTKYSVRIKSSVGEINILESKDKAFVERILSAINEAISMKV